MADLFSNAAKKNDSYTAKDIEVLEGLEPVRRRPGMYIGGTDERALHHLIAEVLDNSMDEAVAGHADWIEVELAEDDWMTIRDNGRGIPVDPHPRFPKKSALEVILTTLHSGGKFSNKAYSTSGGLHGVGVSVVNALSDEFEVEVARDKALFAQKYSRGVPQGPLKKLGATNNRRGTTVRFHPDAQIFGKTMHFKPQTVYKMARAKAFLFKGVEIRWKCTPSLLKPEWGIPAEQSLRFPGGPCGLAGRGDRQAALLHAQAVCRRREAGRAGWPPRMGRRMARRRGRGSPLLRQHGTHAAGAAATSWACVPHSRDPCAPMAT